MDICEPPWVPPPTASWISVWRPLPSQPGRVGQGSESPRGMLAMPSFIPRWLRPTQALLPGTLFLLGTLRTILRGERDKVWDGQCWREILMQSKKRVRSGSGLGSGLNVSRMFPRRSWQEVDIWVKTWGGEGVSRGASRGRTVQADTPKQKQASQEQETGQRHPDWKGRRTLASFSDDVIPYGENRMESERKVWYYEN